MIEDTLIVNKSNNAKSPITPKQAGLPFSEKMPFIRSLILDSVTPGSIKRIYLFGSYAYGRPTMKSDVDLCIIINDKLLDSKTDIKFKIALSLFDNKIIPADVLVYTEKQFNDIKNPNGIKKTIQTKGQILYE